MPNPVGLARLMGRSRAVAAAMLRMAGLDDESMDLEEAWLKRELHRLQAQRAGPGDAETEAADGVATRQMVARDD